MARPSIFPSVDDRTFNEPIVLVDAKRVLALYNQSNEEVKKTVDEVVKDWFVKTALENKWSAAIFKGNQCLLTADIPEASENPDQATKAVLSQNEVLKPMTGRRNSSGASSNAVLFNIESETSRLLKMMKL